MKKILSIVLCAATASAFAEGEPVVAEIGTVGVTAITTSLSNAIVAVSYDDLADNEGGMVYSNLVKTTNLTAGDSLTAGDRLVEFRDNKYTAWELEQSGDVKYWKELKESYLNASGKQIDLIAPAPDTVRGAVGTGIWLVRQNPLDSNGNTNSFYIYGKPSTSRTVELVPGKWNLVGNPTQGKVTISANLVNGASHLDQLVLPVAPDGKLCYYMYQSGTGWCKRVKGGWDATPPELEAGLGCWILTENDASINWSTVTK